MRSACAPASAISPPLHSRSCAPSSLASLVLADGDESVAVRHQPAVAGRIRRRESRAPTTAAPSASGARSCASVCGADQRRVAEHHQNVVGAASRSRRAPPAPHARCRAARVCTKICGIGAHAARLGRRRRRGPGRPPPRASASPACGAAASTCASRLSPADRRAAPSAARSACACPRRPRAQSPDRSVRSFDPLRLTISAKTLFQRRHSRRSAGNKAFYRVLPGRAPCLFLLMFSD